MRKDEFKREQFWLGWMWISTQINIDHHLASKDKKNIRIKRKRRGYNSELRIRLMRTINSSSLSHHEGDEAFESSRSDSWSSQTKTDSKKKKITLKKSKSMELTINKNACLNEQTTCDSQHRVLARILPSVIVATHLIEEERRTSSLQRSRSTMASVEHPWRQLLDFDLLCCH